MAKRGKDELSKVVLWQLAGLRAAVMSLEIHLSEMEGNRPKTSEEVRRLLRQKQQLEIYRMELQQAGIPETSPPQLNIQKTDQHDIPNPIK